MLCGFVSVTGFVNCCWLIFACVGAWFIAGCCFGYVGLVLLVCVVLRIVSGCGVAALRFACGWCDR